MTPHTENTPPCFVSLPLPTAERSSSEGWLIEDAFGFPDGLPPVRLVFGCENGETGEIYRQMADGIMGMGNNHNAFQSQVSGMGQGPGWGRGPGEAGGSEELGNKHNAFQSQVSGVGAAAVGSGTRGDSANLGNSYNATTVRSQVGGCGGGGGKERRRVVKRKRSRGQERKAEGQAEEEAWEKRMLKCMLSCTTLTQRKCHTSLSTACLPPSSPDPQLVKTGVIEDVFSLCFGYPKDGILLLGACRESGYFSLSLALLLLQAAQAVQRVPSLMRQRRLTCMPPALRTAPSGWSTRASASYPTC